MASKYRNLIAANIASVLRNTNAAVQSSLNNRTLASQLKVRLDSDNNPRIYFRMPAKAVQKSVDSSSLVQQFPVDHTVTSIDTGEVGKIKFYVEPSHFSSQIINTTLSRPRDYQWSRNALFPDQSHKLMVEFSSPNIAKPFHIGHLRSTIIGNFVANISQKVGNHVTRVNYLGDWGTQFGLLLAGLEECDHIDNVDSLTLSDLLSVYIQANQKASQDSHFAARAQTAFTDLETGDSDKERVWQHCRDVTIQELQRNYHKLNVRFDHFHGESMYRKSKAAQVLELLDRKKMLKLTDDGRTVIPLKNNNVTMQKSDGSSLYISRDIAAALDRREKFQFDRMFYVVDNSQGTHFNNLFEILRGLGCDWWDACSHVKFGKILGMSTRSGNIVLMTDIIEEATVRMLAAQDRSVNTKVEGDQERLAVAEMVGLSALIVNDLQQRRTKDYHFSWDRALSDSGDTGVKLQYTHARLCSLIDKCQDLSTDLDNPGDYLQENIALELTVLLARYDEVLSQSYNTLEAFHLVKYLFQLCNTTSKALKLLPVKHADTEELAVARLKMFMASRKVLADGMTTMGITPLDRI